MTFTVESKSQLAKLLATENLTIEHQKIRTAMFDPKNRVLYCPIWQDMSGALYDLMLGHEVGHALYTPAEGWHNAVSTLGRKYKGFLNVVEDARIEKKIKRKYPGIRSSFVKGYQSLTERDFFGLKGRNLNTMSFIDRLNLFTKSAGTTKVDFSDEENALVRQVESCETWEDVLRVTQSVFDYSKDEQFETMQSVMEKMKSQDDQDDQDGDDGSGDDYEFSEYDDDAEDFEDEGGDQNIGEKRDIDGEDGDESSKGKQSKSDNEDGDGEDGEDEGSKINPFKDSKASTKDQFQPNCETDENFRNNEGDLVSQDCKPYVYGRLPEPNLDAIVTPAKRVHELLEAYYFNPERLERRTWFLKEYIDKVKEFKSKNERYISLLAKEFEMKKAARSYAKAKVSNTGDIDIGKLYKYQVEDNIFRKMMRVPKGKSHGLVLLLDRSGSMSNNMAGSIEQILVLAMFCRKVNIPFVVYGFGDSEDGRLEDFPNERFERKKCFDTTVNEFAFDTVYLREYINSKMSTSEFNRCVRNLIILRDAYGSGMKRYAVGYPNSESLGNTPLIQAMVALEPITKKFRKLNNLDLINLVIVHDGDADNCNFVNQLSEARSWGLDQESKIRPVRFGPKTENVFIKDRNSKLQVKVDSSINDSFYTREDGFRIAIFNWFRATTGAKIFGFFIAGQGRDLRCNITNKYIDKNNKTIREMIISSGNPFANHGYRLEKSDVVKNIVSKLKSEKFVQSYNSGYESFFILPGGTDLQIEDEELVVSGIVTASKLKTAFMKMNKKKTVNRVMVSRFIDGIAA